jgi:dynein heavy chain
MALKLNKGAALYGDSGAGKSETIKEFSKMIGRMPVVFNCSEDVSLKFIYTFILGIYEAQVYGIFDEFNRISTKNLSIISTSFSEFEEKKKKIILDSQKVNAMPSGKI